MHCINVPKRVLISGKEAYMNPVSSPVFAITISTILTFRRGCCSSFSDRSASSKANDNRPGEGATASGDMHRKLSAIFACVSYPQPIIKEISDCNYLCKFGIKVSSTNLRYVEILPTIKYVASNR